MTCLVTCLETREGKSGRPKICYRSGQTNALKRTENPNMNISQPKIIPNEFFYLVRRQPVGRLISTAAGAGAVGGDQGGGERLLRRGGGRGGGGCAGLLFFGHSTCGLL